MMGQAYVLTRLMLPFRDDSVRKKTVERLFVPVTILIGRYDGAPGGCFRFFCRQGFDVP